MTTPFIYPLRVHMDDTDFMGVVYHSNYLNFMERARSEWAEQWGCGIVWQREQGMGLVVHSIQIDYLKPAKLHEQVEVVTAIKAVKPASLVYDQYLRLATAPATILCRAEVKIACVDTAMRPRALPEAMVLTTMRRT